VIGRQLCQELVVRNPSGRREPGFRTYPGRYLHGDFGRRLDRLPVLGDVKIGFIQGQRLDQMRMFGKDLAYLKRHRLVGIETRFDEDQVTALPFGVVASKRPGQEVRDSANFKRTVDLLRFLIAHSQLMRQHNYLTRNISTLADDPHWQASAAFSLEKRPVPHAPSAARECLPAVVERGPGATCRNHTGPLFRESAEGHSLAMRNYSVRPNAASAGRRPVQGIDISAMESQWRLLGRGAADE
jgi:hypothetical protein